MSDSDLQERCINVVRGFAMDAPTRAKNGHPGTAMALAPLAYTLWTRIMRYDASQPDWPNRDRFVLSNGHASILLYSMLHLTGYGLTKQDIEDFRQWGSPTPGHPEVHHTAGVEVTTGPLGQGFANGVGMAIAENHLRARYGSPLFDHHTFVIAGDGCLMEGISHEAASLAGHLGVDKLIVIYDDNHITIDGPTELALDDDAAARFEAYGWHVEHAGEIANDVDALEAVVRRGMAVENKPVLITLRSHIGYPSPKFTDTAKAHGDPFPPEEIAETKKILGIPDEDFWCPDDVLAHYREAGRRGAAEREAWDELWAEWPEHKEEIEACFQAGGLPGWEDKLPVWNFGDKAVATRNASKACLDAVLDVVPGLIGGGADLTGNTGVLMPEQQPYSVQNRTARQIHFGVREHGMGGVMNGMAHHGGVLPIGGTFFVFSDYMRAAVRVAALSESKLIFSFTHDSVGLGQDGPTHQPIEQLASLRAMPGLRLIRPADANETAMAWRVAVNAEDGPTALVLSRQDLDILEGTAGNEGVLRGAYVLREADGGSPSLVIVATGSEVALAVAAAAELEGDGTPTRVVSMPSWDLFELQDEEYQTSVLGSGVPRLSVEAGSTFGWSRWVDASVGIDRFGASAPGAIVLEKLGMNVPNVVAHAKQLLARS